jgi:hypothetical protein
MKVARYEDVFDVRPDRTDHRVPDRARDRDRRGMMPTLGYTVTLTILLIGVWAAILVTASFLLGGILHVLWRLFMLGWGLG